MDIDLSTALQMHPFSPKQRISILLDVVQGVEYLHSLPALHRDLKPQNILLKLTCYSSGKVIKVSACITDFGITKMTSEHSVQHCPGTPPFIAPELYEDESKYEPSADIYSFGLIMFLVLVRDPSFDSYVDTEGHYSTSDAIRSGVKPVIPSRVVHDFRDASLFTLMESCWGNPASRPSASAIAQQLKKIHDEMPSDMK
eukprot:TRINITY_DN21068_c0_g1_i1.p1 TRINITY_DN21068_c0_g1~~TRINITY_DN21068_c0_g1_i1.p1  ORF type:complete len:221 (+),score=52.13 TRINITY_DN21068_c0_g1_i1:67-663(+)